MKKLALTTFSFFALTLLGTISQAASVPITNGTFDATNNTANGGGTLGFNQYTILYGSGVTVFDALTGANLGTANVPGFTNVGNNFDGVQYIDPTMYFTPTGAPTTQPTGNITLNSDVPNKSIATSPDNVLSNTNVAPNSTYTLTLDLYKRTDLSLPDTFQMQLFAGGVDLGGTLTIVMPTDTQPGQAKLVVTTGASVSGGALSAQLSAGATNPSDLRQIVLDNLALDAKANASTLALTDAVSRKIHGTAGTFDIELPQNGSGVECRSSNGNHEFVFTFTNGVVSGNATLSAPAGGSIAGSPTFAGNTMTVELTGVTNDQTITVTLHNVTDTFSQVLPDTDISAGMLIGDSSGNKTVDLTDYNLVKAQVGAPVTANNFREDLDVNGTITHADGKIVRVYRNTNLP
ncbi:MAG: hypothetical protein H0X40_05710 [Chthoniobacterales bacterium]|nr:hypothetical protein [Chthoniobacterales bacterium]